MVLTTTTTTTNATRRRISTIYDHFALPSLEKGHHHHLRHRQKHKQQQQQNDDDMAIIERNNTFGLFSNIKNKNNNKETTTKKKKKKKFTVAVLGAAGGIGQTLSLLLKQSEMIKSLRLYDIAPITPGIAVDLSHINTESEVLGFAGPEQLQRALEGCDLVIIPAGIPRKPGMTRDDLFKINAGIVRDLTIGVAKHCPNAIVNIISNPVNSTVPIAVEVLKKYYVFDPRKVLGVTKLDVMRAETFIHGLRKNELTDSIANIKVPVIGGHAGATIIPLLSQVTPKFTKPFEGEELIALTTRIQNAGTEVVDAKAGAGSATLSMALAAENMATSCLKAMAGEKNIIECAYVSSNLIPELSFFASKVKLGVHGVDEILELGAMTKFEQKMVQDAIPELKASIDKGVDFARKSM